MKTKKVNLNEFKILIKKIIKEEYEDEIPDISVDINKSLLELLNYYSTPQILDAMVKFYENRGESQTVNRLKLFSNKMRKDIYNPIRGW